MAIQFSNATNEVLRKKNLCLYLFEENSHPVLEISSRNNNDSEFEGAVYKIKEREGRSNLQGFKYYEFTLSKNCGDKFPDHISGEYDFRKMIENF